MGMHYGVIAAPTSQQVFLEELRRHAGEFALGDVLEHPFVIKYGPEGKLWELAVGERDGRVFLLDPDMVLATCPA